ncbi:RING finger protein [Teratosphaeria destructans]|uniref:RING finger protein n=1 Tax=Teratosphaeria destructans TaxID=418781 RepID=A0A9W7W5R5_9PEZI|nr:RING finger protein [Teratosphaeria destructans]
MSVPPAASKANATSNKPASLGNNGSSNSSSLAPSSSSQTQQYFSTPRAVAATPKGSQAGKPKHKHAKKFHVLDDDERVAMHNIGRRGKTADITHLMNIALPPRPPTHGQYHRHSYNGPRGGRGGGGGGGARYNATWGLGSGYHAVDKARYIHANYRFIVDPQGDYHAHAADADVHLDWNHVLQIIASEKTQHASCPICLGDPTAPRMAKCGHIFCLPCLIRYMHSDDGDKAPPEKKARWKKCPICYDSIYISETRPVRWYAGQELDPPREGGDVVLRLVKRKTGSTMAMPRESADTVAKGEAIPWYFAAEVMDYARIMKGSEEYMLAQYNQAIAAIQQTEKEDELMFGEDAEWTGRAVRMLREAKEKVKGIGNPPAQPKKPEVSAVEKRVDERPPIQFHDSDGVPDMYLHKQAAAAPSALIAAEGADASDETMVQASAIPKTIHEMRQRQFEKPQPSEYLFYQALQRYYLSPLDIRILKSAFGSYQHFPSSILPRVERASTGHIVDDELRKRVKYLGHLPYGCEVAFLECDWTDTVPPHVLEEFRPMLERRRKRHDEKEAREEKDRIRIEKAEERELAHIRRKRVSVADDPVFSTGEWEALPPSSSLQEIGGAASPPWGKRAGSGFASLASPSTSPNTRRTVWGTTAVAPTESDEALISDDQWAQRDDGWLQGWEKDLMDQQDAAAINNAVEGMSLEGAVHSSTPKSGGKKGKKKNKITLMSTTARRGA